MARPRKHPAGAQTPLLTADAAPLPEIPVAEQPYPLPKGWKWVRLGDCNCYAGKNINPDSFPEKMFELYSVPSSMDDYPEILSGDEIGSAKQTVEPDDVLLCKINPRINRVWRVAGHTNHILVASSEWIVFRNKNISSKYMMYCMKSQYFRNYMLSNVSGVGGSLMRAQPKHVRCYPIPLPPREEQERIVARIESLFAKLDEAREKIVAVAERYEPRRAALLHKAFSGELTAKWREEKGNAAGWKNVLFSDVADIKSNLVDPADFQTFPHIAPDNIEKKTGILLQYNTVAEDKVTSGKHRFYPGQILYSKIRPYLSKVVIVDFDGLCSADMYPIDAKENTKYLWYYMLSEEFLEQASTAGSRSVLPKINQKELSRIRIPLPPLPEQEEIVRLLDGLLERERQIREAAEQVRERIDLMKKAILARAFRGELGGDGGATH